MNNLIIRKIRQLKSFLTNQQTLIYILSFLVGLVSALAAVVMKNAIHFTHVLFTQGVMKGAGGVLSLAYPLAGIFLTMLAVKYLVRDNISHGISRVLYAISKRKSYIKPHNNWSSILTSSLTIGFGGSVGAEAPIVLTGASIGSNIARHFKLNYKYVTLLLGCGVAGAISGIFKAPFGGILFTLEVLMLDLTMSSIVPLLISSVTAATVAFFFMGDNVLFSFQVKQGFMLSELPYYLILGVFCGLVGIYFTRATIGIEKLYKRIGNKWIRMVAGGSILGALIYFYPALYGEGYETVLVLLNAGSGVAPGNEIFGNMAAGFWSFSLLMAGLLLVKVVATASTNGAGGVGGIVAPVLFTGGVAGYYLSSLLNHLFGLALIESSFTLTAMAGVFSAVLHAPLTAIFLIAEITEGYALLIPLILTSTVAFITARTFQKYSIYNEQLAITGELITHDKDKAVMTLLDWSREVEKDLLTVRPDSNLGDLVKQISKSNRNLFPVVDEFNILEGVVLLDDVRDKMFRPELYDKITVRELMTIPPSYIDLSERGDAVLDAFERTGAWNLPVLDEGRYVGFISKSRIFSAYRELLRQFSEE
ncbi:MAG TPA: chloride channel protein [Bacteroidales bacterium]|nr:chloride channel protein [Bacteroidales bacterium]HNX84210.1 chloride channel protein [Bacteroidales bacterium]HPS96562.1 chloride channel protein [Bacteroidales bacterium]